MDISFNPMALTLPSPLPPAAAGRPGAFRPAPEKARESGDDAALKRACRDFESYFLQIIFREMRKTSFSGENGPAQNDRSTEIFRDMLDEEYAKAAAESGGIGLGETLYKSMGPLNARHVY